MNLLLRHGPSFPPPADFALLQRYSIQEYAMLFSARGKLFPPSESSGFALLCDARRPFASLMFQPPRATQYFGFLSPFETTFRFFPLLPTKKTKKPQTPALSSLFFPLTLKAFFFMIELSFFSVLYPSPHQTETCYLLASDLKFFAILPTKISLCLLL